MALTKATYSMIRGASVNIVDFGADPTGVSDSSTAIQNAIDASSSVYIPPGTYLLLSGLQLKSNLEIFGAGPASILKAGASAMNMLRAAADADRSNISIHDFSLDGGGQTTNVYTGIARVNGMSLDRVSDVRIDNMIIHNMGIVNQADPFGVSPTFDVNYSGFGIRLSARSGAISNIRISRCNVFNIAGTGYQKGDGIYIEGYGDNFAGLANEMDVVVSDCYVSTCGRHCYAVTGGESEEVASGVVFNNCYGEKSGLDGCDIESGYNVILNNCIFRDCGNDQTYYDPVAEFGATFRLLAGVAVDNESDKITVDNCLFERCYYGFTYGASPNITLSNSIFEGSTTGDINQGLASSGRNFKIENCSFLTDAAAFNHNSVTASDFIASSCVFAGQVRIAAMREGIFESCVFRKGFAVIGGSSGFARNKINNCLFTDYAGVAFTFGSALGDHPDNVISNCTFRGQGNLTNAILFGFESSSRAQILNNKFIGLANAAISCGNGGARNNFDAKANNFVSCGGGIIINQAIKNSMICDNSFSSVTGFCIDISNITAATPMPLGPTIQNNMVGDGCTNGIRISTSTGTYDYTMLIGNNVHNASGTKFSISAGNANGVVANNITT